jgi:hypothetical protein
MEWSRCHFTYYICVEIDNLLNISPVFFNVCVFFFEEEMECSVKTKSMEQTLRLELDLMSPTPSTPLISTSPCVLS